MIDKKIDFETALLAKRAGFNWTVDFAYWTSRDPDEKQTLFPYHYSDYRNDYLEYHSAPTQSLLQKWLREKKKCIVYIRPIDNWNSWAFSILMEDYMSPFFEPEYDRLNEFNSYEDALEAGLKKSLELLQ